MCGWRRGRPGAVSYVRWGPAAAGAAGLEGCHGTASACKTRLGGHPSAWAPWSANASPSSAKESAGHAPSQLLNSVTTSAEIDRWGASAPHTPSAFGLAPLACLRHVLTQPENPGPRGLNLDTLKCSKKDNVWAVSTIVCLGQWLSTRNDSVGSGAIFGCHYGDAATSIQWVEARGAAREPTTETRPARNLSGTKAEKCSRVTTRAEMVTPALSALCAQLLNRAWPTADTQPTSAACVSRTLATHISRQTLRHGQRRSRSGPKTHSSAQSEK